MNVNQTGARRPAPGVEGRVVPTETDATASARNQQALNLMTRLARLPAHALRTMDIRIEVAQDGCTAVFDGANKGAAELFRASLAAFVDDAAIAQCELVASGGTLTLRLPVTDSRIMHGVAKAAGLLQALCTQSGRRASEWALTGGMATLRAVVCALVDVAEDLAFAEHPAPGLLCHVDLTRPGACERACALAKALVDARLHGAAIAILLEVSQSLPPPLLLDAHTQQAISDTLTFCLPHLIKRADRPLLPILGNLLRRARRITGQDLPEMRAALKRRRERGHTPKQILRLYDAGNIGDASSPPDPDRDASIKIDTLVTAFHLTMAPNVERSLRNAQRVLTRLRVLAESMGPGATAAKEAFDVCVAHWMTMFPHHEAELAAALNAQGHALQEGRLVTTPQWAGQAVPVETVLDLALWMSVFRPKTSVALVLAAWGSLMAGPPSPPEPLLQAACDLLVSCAQILPEEGQYIIESMGIPAPEALSLPCHQQVVDCRERLMTSWIPHPSGAQAQLAALHANFLHHVALEIFELAQSDSAAGAARLLRTMQFHAQAARGLLSDVVVGALFLTLAPLCGLADLPPVDELDVKDEPWLYGMGAADYGYVYENCQLIGGSDAEAYAQQFGDPELAELHATVTGIVHADESEEQAVERFKELAGQLQEAMRVAFGNKAEIQALRARIAVLASVACASLSFQVVFLEVFYGGPGGYPVPPATSRAFFRAYLHNAAANGTLGALDMLMRMGLRLGVTIEDRRQGFLEAVALLRSQDTVQAAARFVMACTDVAIFPSDREDADRLLDLIVELLASQEHGFVPHDLLERFVVMSDADVVNRLLEQCLQADVQAVSPTAFGHACALFVKLCLRARPAPLPALAERWNAVIAQFSLPVSNEERAMAKVDEQLRTLAQEREAALALFDATRRSHQRGKCIVS